MGIEATQPSGPALWPSAENLGEWHVDGWSIGRAQAMTQKRCGRCGRVADPTVTLTLMITVGNNGSSRAWGGPSAGHVGLCSIDCAIKLDEAAALAVYKLLQHTA